MGITKLILICLAVSLIISTVIVNMFIKERAVLP